MKDYYGRTIDYLRLSLTDRCQLACCYCVPNETVEWLAKEDLLTDSEILKFVETFAKLGITKLKLTGGEPLLRKGLIQLISDLKAIEGIEEITLTTNGILLGEMVEELVAAGIDGINVSLDTLNSKRYTLMTRRNQLDKVLAGLEQAATSDLKKLKVNCVLISELNKDEIIKIAKLAQVNRIHVRFIEWMPMGSQKSFTSISEQEVLKLLSMHYGMIKSYEGKLGNGPAHYFEIDGFQGKIGFISAVSQHFCETCNRLRITSDGFLKTCLFFNRGIDLRKAQALETLESDILNALKQKPKAHDFKNKRNELDREMKHMVQIGG